MTQAELLRLARLGAAARLQELQREAEAIYTTFPHLRSGRPVRAQNPHTADVQTAVSGVRGAVQGAVKRRRPKMSREARKRIAEAQRRRWAEWKANSGRATEGSRTSQRTARVEARGSGKKKREALFKAGTLCSCATGLTYGRSQMAKAVS